MNYIQWNSQFETGIEILDNQHKELIGYLNELYVAVEQGRGEMIIDQLLTRLHEYSDKHFEDEEQLMQKFEYPGYQDHFYRHNEFREELVDLTNKQSSVKLMLTIELLEYLKVWVKDHLLKEDFKFVKYMKDRKPRNVATQAIGN